MNCGKFSTQIFVIILMNKFFYVSAGSCYAKIDSDGKCSDLMANDVSKEECCSSLGIGYNDVISNEAIFMLHTGIRRENCHRCKESSCDNVKCGSGKRCIMKRGQPKCICSPNCKANAVINNNRKVDSNGDIEFIKLPDKKLINRPYSVIRPSEMQSDEPTLIIASNNGQNLRQKINQSNNNSEAHGVINTTRLSSLLPQNATVARSIEVISHKTFINDIQFISSYGNVAKFVHYNPVCGSDGKTYKNECQLRKRACRQENKKLEVSHKGFCQTSCKFINCLNGKQCIEDQKFMPQCVTCHKCTIKRQNRTTTSHMDLKKIVCGIDGVTYRSLCELKQKSCKIGKSIGLAYRGACQESLNCNHCSRSQKCLPDLITNRPVCVSCNRPYGRCPMQRSVTRQVCGNNGITYHSKCHLLKDSCNTGFYISVVHEGKCRS